MRKLFFASLLIAVSTLSLTAGCAKVKAGPVVTDKELVVLIHGLGRSNMAMWRLADRLEDADYYVQRVGYRSLTRTPDQIVSEISTQINQCCLHHSNKVHFVGHSLGGLLIRSYLQNHDVEQLGNVVLIGTPNKGTTVVDEFRDHPLFGLFGPMTAALGTDKKNFPSRLTAPDYPVGIIAGYVKNDNPMIPGPNDGLVSVDSTRLKNMTDFIEVEVGHSMMRYDENVAKYTINFLRNQVFVDSQITN